MAGSFLGRGIALTRRSLLKIPKRHGYIVLLPEIGEESSEKNPLLKDDNLPEFNTFTIEKCIAAIGKQTVDFEEKMKSLEKIVDTTKTVDIFNDWLHPIEDAYLPLETTWGIAKTLYFGNQSLMPTKCYLGIHERATRAIASKFGSAPLFKVCKEALDNKDIKLTHSQRRVLTKYVLEGTLNGLQLQDEDFENYSDGLSYILKKMKEYKEKYESSTFVYGMTIHNRHVIEDFPVDYLKSIAIDRILTMKLEGSDINPEIVAELKEKDSLISRICNKYQKLLKNHDSLQQEYEKVNALLAERETEYHQLHMHHKKFTEALQKVEKTNSSLLTFNQKSKAENVQLNEDVLLLKHVIYRLNAELERYQDKLKESGQSILSKNINNVSDSKKSADDVKTISESWGSVNIHVLGPLLDAYEENLSEKQELVNKYEEDITNFSTKCKEIIMENEYMQSEIEKLKSKCTRYTDEIKMMSEDADLLKELNECYTRQTAHQKQKIHEIHSLYEQKVEAMSFDNNRLHEEYLASKTELSNLQGKYDVLHKEYEKLQNDNTKTMPIHVHNAAVEECRELFEKLKRQYETEKEKLSTRIKELEESYGKNKTQLDVVTIERNQLKALNKSFEKRLKHMQRKLEHFQKLTHSIQISRDSFKKQLRKTTLYCEELFSEYERIAAERDKLVGLLHETENENASIHFLGDTITKRVGHLKEQLKVVHEGAKQQVALAEKNMKVQQLGVHRMKDEYHRELKRFKHLLKQKEETIGRLQKEISSTRENLELVWKVTAADSKKVKGPLKSAKIQHV